MNTIFPTLTDEERRAQLDVPTGRIRLVLDTDAKNEIDDQFAVAWALRSPERFEVEAVYPAPFSQDCIMRMMGGGQQQAPEDGSVGGFENITYASDPGDGMRASYDELLKLFDLLGEDSTGRVFMGSDRYVTDNGGAVESDAARDLIKRAMESDEPLYVAAFGAPTNVASALLMEPELVKKIVVIWLGAQPIEYGHGIEFNMMQDIETSRVLLDSGVPLVLIPVMNVVSHLTLNKLEVEQCMLGKSKISDYLGGIAMQGFTDAAAAAQQNMFMRLLYMAGREDRGEEYLAQFPTEHVSWSRIICDIATVAFLKNPGWVLSKMAPSPVLSDNLQYGPVPEGRHLIRIANYCNRDLIFGDMLACLNG